MATEPSFFDTATEDDVLAVPVSGRAMGGDVPVVPAVPAVPMTSEETIRLGMIVVHKGTLAMRGEDEFIGVVTGVFENECDVKLFAPGKVWGGADSFRDVRAPLASLRPFRSRYSIGQWVTFKVREDEKTETLGEGGYRTGSVEKRVTYLDPETDEVKTRVVRTPAIQTEQRVLRGSVYHRSMTTFTAMIVGAYTADDSVDLLLFIPQGPEKLVRGVFEGEGPGTFALVD